MTRRLVVLALTLVAAAGCGGGHTAPTLTPVQRLHAAVKAAHAAWDPDSAGGTGYATDAVLAHRMKPGTYGTAQPWPDDLAFRPGVVYVGTLNGGRLASLWTFETSGRALYTTIGKPHTKVSYDWQSVRSGVLLGRVIIRPGVLSGDMIRAALEHAGFGGIALDVMSGGQLQDGVKPLLDGGTPLGSSPGDRVSFIIFRTAADARKANADMGLPPHAVSVIVGTVMLRYKATPSVNRSQAFRRAVAQLRQELRTE